MRVGQHLHLHPSIAAARLPVFTASTKSRVPDSRSAGPPLAVTDDFWSAGSELGR
jgi:hypothetical protein